jgi:hypothetical protein
MGTAPKKSRATGQLACPAGDVRVPESMEFLPFEDDGGTHHWRIVAGSGATHAQSESSVSYDRAEQAGPPLITPSEQPALSRQPGPGPIYSCPGCGHVLRVSGLGRHRLYFDRPNSLVMTGVCPVCRYGLPGKNRV